MQRLSYLACIAACTVVAACGQDTPSVAEADVAENRDSQERPTPAAESNVGSSSIPRPCGNGGLALGDVVAVTRSHDLRAASTTDAQKVKNEKASRILGKTHFHQIDGSTTVRRRCVERP